MSRARISSFSLLAPPYRDLLAVDPAEGFPSNPEVLWGVGLVWRMEDGMEDLHLDFAAERPGGLPLIVLLPPVESLRRGRSRILEVVEEARPHSILPHHPIPDPDELCHLLRREPESLSGELLDFLHWRGVRLDGETRRIARRIVELSQEVATLSAVAKGLYLSRRALGRRFSDRGLPVPSHWLQFCRILRAVIRMQNSDASLFDVARSLRYPDGFTLSNQMERILGVRPSLARERLGWEWVVEAWLLQERRSGGLTFPLRGESWDGDRVAASPSALGSGSGGSETPGPEERSGAKRGGAAA